MYKGVKWEREDAVNFVRRVEDSSPLADAARAYVAARLANDAAEPKDWTHHAAEVDRTWSELLAIYEEIAR